MEGTFDGDSGRLKVKSGPPETYKIVEALNRALDDAKKGVEVKKIIADVRENSPVLADGLERANRRGGLALVITMLMFFISGCSIDVNETLNWNQLVDQALVAMFHTKPYPFPGAEKNEEHEEEPETRTRPQVAVPQRKFTSKRQRRRMSGKVKGAANKVPRTP